MENPVVKKIMGLDFKFTQGAKRMPVGEYCVTDPCYFLGRDDQLWSEVCHQLRRERECDLTVEVLKHKIFIWGTCYGDGCYSTYKNGEEVGESGVDAGLLSLIPIKLFAKMSHLLKREDLGEPIVAIVEPFTPIVKRGNCEYSCFKTLTGPE